MSFRKHNARCELSRKKKCVCGCRGKLHGKLVEQNRQNPNDKTMMLAFGGDVQAFLEKVHGKTMICWCDLHIQISSFDFAGYPHDNGLADGQGNKWWVYLHCDNCGYDWSFWKVENRAKAPVELVA